jgi:type I restriction enzyme S subunit
VGGRFAYVPKEKAMRLAANTAGPFDIVFTQRGANHYRQVAVVPAASERMVISQSQMKLTVDPSKADALFVYYAFRSRELQDYLQRNAIQTGVPHTNLGILRNAPVPLPPLPVQRRIANVLGSLDDKIELNRRISETLESMARTIFKSWFVDFDPVRARAEGHRPRLPNPIARLFPKGLEDSDLGDIPSGWRSSSLADFAVLNPESWSNDGRPDRLAYVDLSNTKWGRIEAITLHTARTAPSRAQRVLRRGDTIVGTVRPGNGSYALVTEDGLTGSTGFAVLRPLRRHYEEFVYLAATDYENINTLARLADGAAYPAIRPEVVLATPVTSADAAVLRFSALSKPLLQAIARNDRETRTLGALRDALLPKLMSGELHAPKADMLLGAAPT